MRNAYSVKLKGLEINRKVRTVYYPRAVWWLQNNRKRNGIAITAFIAMAHYDRQHTKNKQFRHKITFCQNPVLHPEVLAVKSQTVLGK